MDEMILCLIYLSLAFIIGSTIFFCFMVYVLCIETRRIDEIDIRIEILKDDYKELKKISDNKKNI